jgi:hemoglobin-like flavoprotein
MVDAVLVNQVVLSYGRCLKAKDFWGDFYDIFLASSPEIGRMFQSTDIEKQKKIINSSLNFVLMYAKDPSSAFANNELNKIGVTHDNTHRNVRPDMYRLWIDSLVQAVKKNDGERFTPELEKSWREVLEPAIALLKSKYHAPAKVA